MNRCRHDRCDRDRCFITQYPNEIFIKQNFCHCPTLNIQVITDNPVTFLDNDGINGYLVIVRIA